MQIGIRFRCHLNPTQEQTLLQRIGGQLFIYNARVGETGISAVLRVIFCSAPVDQRYRPSKTQNIPWLSEVSSVVLSNGAALWKQACNRYFSKRGGRPVIRAKHGKQSMWLTPELFQFVPVVDGETGKIIVHQPYLGIKKLAVGVLTFVAHKAYKIPALLHVSIHAGQRQVSFSANNPVPDPSDQEITDYLVQFDESDLFALIAGIDRGIAIPVAVAVSYGQTFGFSPIQKSRLALGQITQKRWRYREVAHQTSHALANNPQHKLFVFEALKAKNMTACAMGNIKAPGENVRQKFGLSRSILASERSQTKTVLRYKARRQGKLRTGVPPHIFSQECAACDHVHKDKWLSQAMFVSQSCGNSDSTDRNTNKVIAQSSIKQQLPGQFHWNKQKKHRITRSKSRAKSAESAGAMRLVLEETAASRGGGGSASALGSENRSPLAPTPSFGI